MMVSNSFANFWNSVLTRNMCKSNLFIELILHCDVFNYSI